MPKRKGTMKKKTYKIFRGGEGGEEACRGEDKKRRRN